MSYVAIRAEDLSKRYSLGRRQRYPTLRDAMSGVVRAGRRLARPGNGHAAGSAPDEPRSIWALRDVSFDLRQGETLGIVGRNGAGKSTLLKILSRITEPTRGVVDVRGRVASLLEVGTGFHPELTGRENIYLSGAILGMRKAEIARKFDEIVAFAEVEDFIDTTAKHYSSGMYMRLAFAVAAHLEPEILLVDEVLAVGDAAFQKKCVGKMQEAGKEGRTILFVSHNVASVLSLCRRAVLIESGRLVAEGPVQGVVQRYLEACLASDTVPLDERRDRKGDGSARLVSVSVESADDDRIIRCGSRLRVSVRYRSDSPINYPRIHISINDYSRSGIYLMDTDIVGGLPDTLPPEGQLTCVTGPINLTEGRCYLNMTLYRAGAMTDYIQYAGHFDVAAEDVYGTGKLPPREWILCLLPHTWALDADR